VIHHARFRHQVADWRDESRHYMYVKYRWEMRHNR
jgi:hypothetical protein